MELNWLGMLGIAVGLALDAFAVSIVVGLTLSKITPRHVFRLSFHFGLFQFLMPIIGWTVGESLAAQLGGIDHWVAFALLALVGGKMLWDAWNDKPPEERGDPTRGFRLVTLSVATSIDALAVGMSMALWGVSVWTPSVVIGAVTAALTMMGIRFGNYFGARLSHWAEIVGGGVLIFIGVKMLLEHLGG